MLSDAFLRERGTIYGAGKPVQLKLTGKAARVYNDTDPLHIYEMDYDGMGNYFEFAVGHPVYCVRGVIDRDDITEFELIELLESMYEKEDK